MKKFFNLVNVHALLLACLILPASFTLVGCDANDGPAERTGRELDEAGEEIKDAVDDTTRD